MKYLLVVFAVMVLSLWWLSHRYHKKIDEAKIIAASIPVPALPSEPAHAKAQPPKPVAPVGINPTASTALPATTAAKGTTAPVAPPASSAATPVKETAKEAEATTEEPEKPQKDWPQLCYNASMLAEKMARRHNEGASLAELTNIANAAEPDTHDMLKNMVAEANSSPRSSDFAQQQLMMDTYKSNAYNTCMDNRE